MKTLIEYWQCGDYALTWTELFPSDLAGKAIWKYAWEQTEQREQYWLVHSVLTNIGDEIKDFFTKHYSI